MFFKNGIQALSDDQIFKTAPAVFAEDRHPTKTSESRYLFVPTIEVVNSMRNEGWNVVSAVQTMNRATTDADRMANKHALFFARSEHLGREFNLRDTLPMVKLENSHNGLSSFNLTTGFFRKVCSNGLTVPETIYAAPKIKHLNTDQVKHAVIDATYKVLNDFPKLEGVYQTLSQINLEDEEKALLADSVSEVFFTPEERLHLKMQAERIRARYGERHASRALLESQLLAPKRHADQKNDLWTVTNVIQENLIRGNIQLADQTGKMRFQRKVTSIDKDKKIHDVLFTITEHFAREKGYSIAVA
jgi:hypothetical protein